MALLEGQFEKFCILIIVFEGKSFKNKFKFN